MLAIVPIDPLPNNSTATFDDFWTLYPRREARKDALKMWERMSEADRMQAVVAIYDWRRIWASQGRDTRTTPMPATWLNGERWTDELPVATHVSSSHVPFPKTADNFVRSEMPAHVREALAKLRKS